MDSQPNIWTFICQMFSQYPTNPSAIRNLGMFEGSGSCDKQSSSESTVLSVRFCTVQCVSLKDQMGCLVFGFCRSIYCCHVQKIGLQTALRYMQCQGRCSGFTYRFLRSSCQSKDRFESIAHIICSTEQRTSAMAQLQKIKLNNTYKIM